MISFMGSGVLILLAVFFLIFILANAARVNFDLSSLYNILQIFPCLESFRYNDPSGPCASPMGLYFASLTLAIDPSYTNPLAAFPAHWAPNDLLFYTGNQFPDRYKNGAFIAFHGSTNRGPYPQAGYVVAFVPFENGKPIGEWEVFADGFAGVETIVNVSDAKYRPMGLAQGPDGSLYVNDSKQGKIWRILYKEDKSKFTLAALAKME